MIGLGGGDRTWTCTALEFWDPVCIVRTLKAL
jgi:hypothetical protein